MDKHAGFEELFRAEYPGVVRELTAILGDRALAQDIAGDAFVEVWRNWDRVVLLDRPGAWLRRVALRQAGRARWRRGRRGAVEASYSSWLDAGERDLDLARALALLPRAQRTAVVMHQLGGWPTAEIAEILACADVTVRSHLSRGRARLGELLAHPDEPLEVTDAEPG